MILRDYQKEGKAELYRNIRSGILENILWLQTGGGKSVLFSSIIDDIVKSYGYVVLSVKRRELIKQASGHMDKWGIPHGVHMSNHPRRRPREKVQVCSIDTLDARSLYPHNDKTNVAVIIDECHDCTPRARKYAKFFKSYEGKPKIGFTATPFSDNSLWNGIVKPIEAHELMEQGFLVPDKTFVPNIIDTSNVTISRGEFNEAELFEVSSRKEIVGDFVRDWKLYAQNRPTILFAVNVKHSKIICDAFNEAGIRACHADANTNSRERDRLLRRLVDGEISVITNVNIFSTGVDIPEVSAIQICRPTQSLIWHLQAIGRGLRPAPHVGKRNCIIIDNAGNTLRHGRAYKIREAQLGKPKRKKRIDIDENDVGIKRCRKCASVYEPHCKECPECGYSSPKQQRSINQKDGDLIEHEMSEEEKQALIKSSFVGDYHKLTAVSNRTKKIYQKKKWVWHKLIEKYGLTTCKQYGHIINMEF